MGRWNVIVVLDTFSLRNGITIIANYSAKLNRKVTLKLTRTNYSVINVGVIRPARAVGRIATLKHHFLDLATSLQGVSNVPTLLSHTMTRFNRVSVLIGGTKLVHHRSTLRFDRGS